MNRNSFIRETFDTNHLNQDDLDAIKWVEDMKEKSEKWNKKCIEFEEKEYEIVIDPNGSENDMGEKLEQLALFYFPSDEQYADYLNWKYSECAKRLNKSYIQFAIMERDFTSKKRIVEYKIMIDHLKDDVATRKRRYEEFLEQMRREEQNNEQP